MGMVVTATDLAAPTLTAERGMILQTRLVVVVVARTSMHCRGWIAALVAGLTTRLRPVHHLMPGRGTTTVTTATARAAMPR